MACIGRSFMATAGRGDGLCRWGNKEGEQWELKSVAYSAF